MVAYDRHAPGPAASLALVESLTADDLVACAARAQAWHHAGAGTPLLLSRDEFARSLDAFPIEYGDIIDAHTVLVGDDPFAGLAIRADDLRRACEVQAKSHLLHLRENFVECGGRPADVRALVADSAPALAPLLRRLARLDGVARPARPPSLADYAASRCGLDPRVVGDVLALAADADTGAVDAVRLFPEYLAAVERLCAVRRRLEGRMKRLVADRRLSACTWPWLRAWAQPRRRSSPPR